MVVVLELRLQFRVSAAEGAAPSRRKWESRKRREGSGGGILSRSLHSARTDSEEKEGSTL